MFGFEIYHKIKKNKYNIQLLLNYDNGTHKKLLYSIIPSKYSANIIPNHRVSINNLWFNLYTYYVLYLLLIIIYN